MKKIIVTMFLVLTGPFGMQLAYAHTNIEGIVQQSKVSIEQISTKAKIDGFETYYGDKFTLKEIINAKNLNPSEILKKNQIELKNGGIFYPEELAFAFRGKVVGTNRAPQTTD